MQSAALPLIDAIGGNGHVDAVEAMAMTAALPMAAMTVAGTVAMGAALPMAAVTMAGAVMEGDDDGGNGNGGGCSAAIAMTVVVAMVVVAVLVAVATMGTTIVRYDGDNNRTWFICPSSTNC